VETGDTAAVCLSTEATNYGTFVPAYFRSRERKFHRWNFRSLELSFPGTFAPGSESTLELSLPIRISLNDDETAGQTTSKSIIVSLNWAVVHCAVVDGADIGLSNYLMRLLSVYSSNAVEQSN